MALAKEFPFSTLSDDEFFFHFYTDRQSTRLFNHVNNLAYDTRISNELNRNSEELILNLDDNDNAQHFISSSYFTESQFKCKFQQDLTNNFLLLHLNIRSLGKNIDRLVQLLDNCNSDNNPVIGLTETRLNQSPNSL